MVHSPVMYGGIVFHVDVCGGHATQDLSLKVAQRMLVIPSVSVDITFAFFLGQDIDYEYRIWAYFHSQHFLEEI